MRSLKGEIVVEGLRLSAREASATMLERIFRDRAILWINRVE